VIDPSWFNKGVEVDELKHSAEIRKVFQVSERVGAPDACQALKILEQEEH
jgi:hypothetical protein